MATLTTNISNVSISVSGNTTQTATISWTCPTVPAGSTITSCRLTGNASSFTTGNKGATLTINNTSVSSGSSFTINLGTGNNTTSVTASFKGNHKQSNTSVTLSNLVYTVEYTEPVMTYTVTFKDWDGSVLKTEEVGSGSSATAPEVSRYGYVLTGWSVDFSNVTSDIITVAQYAIANILNIKENGNWIDIGKVYKRVSGNWVEQENYELNSLFDLNTRYDIAKPNPVAILYSDGTLIFQDSDVVDTSHGDVVGTYTGWDVDEYTQGNYMPWYNNLSDINKIIINTIVSPIFTNYWFYRCSNLTFIDLSNLDTSNVTNMSYMFFYCRSLASLNVSSFDTSNVTSMERMFSQCYDLTSLDISSFDMTNVNSTYNMFYECTSLQTIYVKDETAKTKIEASNNFPTGASVIIGKPN